MFSVQMLLLLYWNVILKTFIFGLRPEFAARLANVVRGGLGHLTCHKGIVIQSDFCNDHV